MKKLLVIIAASLLSISCSNQNSDAQNNKGTQISKTQWGNDITNFGIVNPSSNVTFEFSCSTSASYETGKSKLDNGKIETVHYNGEIEFSTYSYHDKNENVLSISDFDKYYLPDGEIDTSKVYQNNKESYVYIEEIYDLLLFFGVEYDDFKYDSTLECYRANSITLTFRNSSNLNGSHQSEPNRLDRQGDEIYTQTLSNLKYYFKNKKLVYYSFSIFGENGRSDYEVTLSDYGTTVVNMPQIIGHTYSSLYSYNDNSHWHACTDYGYYYLSEGIESHGYSDVVTPSTFEEQGYTTHTCSICGYSFIDSYTDVKPHNFSDDWSIDDVKNTHYHACIDEGYENLRSDEEPHEYIITDVPSTFEMQGYTLHTCKCGKNYKDNYKPLKPHNYSESWTVTELVHYHVCLDEGYEDLKTEYNNHTYGNWIIVTEPGESTKGIKERYCNVCGHKQTESIKPIGSIDKLIFTLSENSYSVKGDSSKLGNGTIYIPDEYNGLPVTIIEEGAFAQSNVTKIIIPNSILSIGSYAFYLSKIEELIIPDSVTQLEYNIVLDCYYLEYISYGANCPHPIDCKTTSLKEIFVSPNNEILSSIDGVLFSKDKTVLIDYPRAREGGQYNVPEGVTAVGSYAFGIIGSNKPSSNKGDYLNCVVLPESVTTIYDYAFNSYEIVSVYIPNTVASIGNNVFNSNTTIFMKYDIDLNRYQSNWNCNAKYIFIGDSVAVDHNNFYYDLKPADWLIVDNCVYYLFDDGTAILGNNAFNINALSFSAYHIHSEVSKNGNEYLVKEVGAPNGAICGKIEKREYGSSTFDYAPAVGSSIDLYSTLSPFQNVILDSVYFEEGIEIIGYYTFGRYVSKINNIYLPKSLTVLASPIELLNYSETVIHFSGTIAEWQKIYKPNAPSSLSVHCTDGNTIY